MSRISRDEMLMQMALIAKQRSTCLRRQVGAVLTFEGRVLSIGYGGSPPGLPHCTPSTCNSETPCVATIHAESNTIAFAARHGIVTKGATLYTTASPCRECAKLLISAGIREVVFDELYRDVTPLHVLKDVGITVRHWRDGFFHG